MQRAAIIGAVVALTLLAAGGFLVVGTVSELSDTRLGQTRTDVPGQRTVRLERGKYVLFYEVNSAMVGDSDSVSAQKRGSAADNSPHIPVPRDLAVQVAPADGGSDAFAFDRYGSEFTVESGGRSGVAINTVRVPMSGTYRVKTTGGAAASQPTVVLGEPSGGRVLQLVLGIVVLVLGGLVSIAAIVLAVLGRKRRSGVRPRR